jgi:hypothetical protein
MIFGAHAMDPIRASDEQYRRAMERGSTALAKAINRLRSGGDPDTETSLQWASNSGSTGMKEGSAGSRIRARSERAAVDKQERSETLRAMRDPCPNCGVRQDIGCEHIRHLYTINEVLTNTRHVDAAWEREVREARKSTSFPDTKGRAE